MEKSPWTVKAGEEEGAERVKKAEVGKEKGRKGGSMERGRAGGKVMKQQWGPDSVPQTYAACLAGQRQSSQKVGAQAAFLFAPEQTDLSRSLQHLPPLTQSTSTGSFGDHTNLGKQLSFSF